jgi:peptide/nickel transport system substrate-binding protein
MNENTDGHERSRRTALKGLAGLATTGGLAGCTGDVLSTQALPGTYKRDVFRYGQVMPPISLDPVAADDPWSMQAIRRIFQSLYVYDRDLTLVPVLADGKPKPNDDGTTYTVSLRDEPTFHDGSDLSPADVKYSFEAPKREATANRWKVDPIEEIRTPDDSTVEFVLSHPYPNFDHSLTQPIVPETARKGNAQAFGRDFVVGTGPYRCNTFEPGKYAVLDRWDDYWGPASPDVDWLKLINVHSGLARTTSLKTGQNDVVERVQPKFWEATDSFPNATVVNSPSYTSYYLGFNTSGTPLENRRMREAVDYLVSMNDFVDEVVGKDGRRQYGPVPPQVADRWGFPVEKWRGIPHAHDRSRARSMLKMELEQMHVSGWTPTIVAPHNDYLAQKLAKKVAHELRTIGFRRARSDKYHWRHFQEKVTSGNQSDYAMFVAPLAGGPDPDSFLYPMVHENMQGLTNGTYYNEESVMRWIDEARKTDARAERKNYYEKASSTLLDDRAVLPAFTLDNSFGVKGHVGGFDPHPMAEYNPMLLAPDGTPSLTQGADD